MQGGTETFYLPALRFNFTRAGNLRLDYGNGHETFAGRRFEIGRMMMDGGVQIMRWLNIGGNAQKGPAIFYDEESPFQGYRRSAGLRIGLQPNARFNSNTSYNFVTFNNQRTGLNAYRVHIVNLRNTYQFTPRFFVRAVTQFDSSRERMLADFLASYELTPGTVIHAGYGSLFGRRTRSRNSIATREQRARSSSKHRTGRASDRRHQAAGARAVAAVGMEERRVVARA